MLFLCVSNGTWMVIGGTRCSPKACIWCTCDELSPTETRVDCKQASLPSIPTVLPPNTTILILADATITTLDGFNATSLRALDVSHNGLQTLTAAMLASSQSSLLRLDVSFNLLTTISPATFDRLTALQHLDLSVNPLTEISLRLFDALSQLTVLSIGGTAVQAPTLVARAALSLERLEQLRISSIVVEDSWLGWLAPLGALTLLVLDAVDVRGEDTVFKFPALPSLQRLYVTCLLCVRLRISACSTSTCAFEPFDS